MAMATFVLDSTWQEVFSGASANCVLHVSGPCQMAIATSAPSTDSLGIPLDLDAANNVARFAQGGLTGQKIYLREAGPYKDSIATVASW